MSRTISYPGGAAGFGILGPLLVRDNGVVRTITSDRQRTLLGILLTKSNGIVSTDYLVDSLWNGRPSRSAKTTLYSYIMRLRRTLGPKLASRIATRDNGYIIEVLPGELDVKEFVAHARIGKKALDSGAWDTSSRELGRALNLWRGEPYSDISVECLQRDESARLQEQRLIVLEWQIDAELHLGHCGEVIPELRRLTAEYPLRERFTAQLMRALSQAGRRGEALAAFEAARHDLADELGLDPSAELTKLQMQILDGRAETMLPYTTPEAWRAGPGRAHVLRRAPRG